VALNLQELSASASLGVISVPRNPDFDCPSGNCTWSEYESLGICPSCKDVTKQAKRSCAQVYGNNGVATHLDCNFTVSEGIVVNMHVMSSEHPGPGKFPEGTKLNSTIATAAALDQPQFSPLLITLIAILRVDADIDDYIRKYNSTEDSEDVPGSLHECELAWCLKKFGPAKVDNGVLEESAPTRREFLDVDTFVSDVHNCTKFANSATRYKTFRDQEHVGYDKDIDSYKRLTESFRECPDVTALSEQEDMYIVNTDDERVIQ